MKSSVSKGESGNGGGGDVIKAWNPYRYTT